MRIKPFILAAALAVQAVAAFAQVYPVNAKLEDKRSFSMIVVPDPQSYIKSMEKPPKFSRLTQYNL